MPTTRRGTNSSPSGPENTPKSNGKRVAEEPISPTAKRGKTKTDDKQQMSIEESLHGANIKENDSTEVKTPGIARSPKDDVKKSTSPANGEEKLTKDGNGEHTSNTEDSVVANDVAVDEKTIEATAKNGEGHKAAEKSKENGPNEVSDEGVQVKDFAQNKKEPKEEPEISNESIKEDEKRETAVPSSILEKGVIYFFFRSRVNVETPQGVEDVARSYIVLRPLPIGARLDKGPLQDDGNARLLVLPKKVLPTSSKDRFLVFVEKGKATIKDLKNAFLSSSDYATKTAGTSHIPPATPIAEGVYAITSTGRESHLAYHITVPELGEIQQELGLKETGSYIVSAKNPKYPAPGNAPSKMAEYSEPIMKEFRDLRWMPLKPELLDYENTQFLIIGEGMGNMGAAMQELSKDKKDDTKDAPEEVMETLEGEDQIRVEHLKGDDAVFADLDLSSKEYNKTQSTW